MKEVDGVRRVEILGRDGANYDITELILSESIRGSVGQCAREMVLSLLVPRDGLPIPSVPTDKGCIVRHMEDGQEYYRGTIVGRGHAAGSAKLELTALDYGWQLSGNEGWYSFRGTPEAAAATICRDYGIQGGDFARTGVSVARKFPGVPLHKIIDTMYAKAAETTGKRYLLRFEGAALCVVEKPEDAGERVLSPGVNLMERQTREDLSKLCTSVEIRRADGGIVRTVDEGESRRLYGLFRHIITQKKNGDALGEAREYLKDHAQEQTITADCLGDTALITGNAVRLEEKGVSGLFWIESDTQTWKNGLYFSKLSLNFRNLKSESNAGKEL